MSTHLHAGHVVPSHTLSYKLDDVIACAFITSINYTQPIAGLTRANPSSTTQANALSPTPPRIAHREVNANRQSDWCPS